VYASLTYKPHIDFSNRENQMLKTFEKLSPEQRTQALYYYFGWQGGTVHQLAQATGLSVDDILYREHGDERSDIHLAGFSAIRTCDMDWRRNTLAPKRQGEWAYWRDAIGGFWATGALSETKAA
jgi:hypothetical protein